MLPQQRMVVSMICVVLKAHLIFRYFTCDDACSKLFDRILFLCRSMKFHCVHSIIFTKQKQFYAPPGLDTYSLEPTLDLAETHLKCWEVPCYVQVDTFSWELRSRNNSRTVESCYSLDLIQRNISRLFHVSGRDRCLFAPVTCVSCELCQLNNQMDCIGFNAF
jgi:hypothetical protein